MFRRKLTALDYHDPNGFDCSDETQFRNCIVWLEDQKIRHYKIEDRGNLRNIPSSDWPKAYEKYLLDLNCPFGVQEKKEALDWLLGLAVRYEYGDNVEKYKNCQPLDTSGNSDKAVDPLVNLDNNSPDFKAGVTALANILKIQRHDDYLVMLKTCPLLLRVFTTNSGRHHRSDEFARGNVPSSELQIYTWMDATLKELTSLVKEVYPEARKKGTHFSFAIVFPDPRVKMYKLKEIGSTVSGRKGLDDAMTLQSQRFQIGDYLDIAITPPNRAPPLNPRMRPF